MPTLRVFDAVLFDMDGTLVDSTPAVERSWNRWAEEYAIPPERLEETRGGRPSAEIVADLVPPERFEEARDRIDGMELADTADIVVLPGVKDLLAAIPVGKWAVVTSSGAALATARLTAAGLSVPDALVSAADVTRGKPDPEAYLTGASVLGADPARCLVVEDSHGGLRAGRAAGATTLAVRTGRDGHDDLDADLVVADLTHVRAAPAPGGVAITLS